MTCKTWSYRLKRHLDWHPWKLYKPVCSRKDIYSIRACNGRTVVCPQLTSGKRSVMRFYGATRTLTKQSCYLMSDHASSVMHSSGKPCWQSESGPTPIPLLSAAQLRKEACCACQPSSERSSKTRSSSVNQFFADINSGSKMGRWVHTSASPVMAS